jgi:hypothetical protein
LQLNCILRWISSLLDERRAAGHSEPPYGGSRPNNRLQCPMTRHFGVKERGDPLRVTLRCWVRVSVKRTAWSATRDRPVRLIQHVHKRTVKALERNGWIQWSSLQTRLRLSGP